MIAAHPGCTLEDMKRLWQFCQENLKLLPRQVQMFTPTPSTYSTLMYWTEQDPFTGKPCFVEKTVPVGRGRNRFWRQVAMLPRAGLKRRPVCRTKAQTLRPHPAEESPEAVIDGAEPENRGF